jgi:hypothetical protein
VAARAAESAGNGASAGQAASAVTSASNAGDAAAASQLPDGMVSVVPGIARYHKVDCILIRFLSDDDLETMTQQAAEKSGCVPCRACRPEKAGVTA